MISCSDRPALWRPGPGGTGANIRLAVELGQFTRVQLLEINRAELNPLSEILEPSPELRADRPAAASARGLADRAELAAIAVERTRMPMVITDPRQDANPIVLANRSFLNLTGYCAEEVIGQNCRFLQGEGTSQAVIAEIRAAVAAEREIDIEILNYRKDGSTFWNQLGVSPIHDEQGRLIYYFASQIDVTEFRKIQALEASEHRLLKEVDHRARNVMAVVNGIVRLSRADDAALYSAAIQQRVSVLAQTHTLLAEHGWRDIAIETVVRQQLDDVDRRVTLSGPRVMIAALNVQPLALALHELLSNALTHGSLASPDGRLEVRWGALPGLGGFELQWRESGAPPHTGRAGDRFGVAMVVGMVEKQLRGQVERDWSDGGLTVTIKAPSLAGAPRGG
jgi:PAS domain S-box-containing protein